MHKKCNFYPLSLFYLGILYKDFKNQWNLSRTRRWKRSTVITEQRFKNVFFDGKENNSIVLFFIIFLILNSILIWLCPIFRTRLIFCRDHEFDCRRQPVKRKIKFGNISEPMAPSRGALPVRQWHQKDESKILATKRLGINI